MGFDCTQITQLGEALDDQMEKCQAAYEQNVEAAARALEFAEKAENAAFLCPLAGPLALPCVVAAGIARELAESAAEDFTSKAADALIGYAEAAAAKDEIDGLAGHCESLESWQEEAFQNLVQEAYAVAGRGVQSECGEEVSELEDVQGALEEALAMSEEAAPPDFG